MTLLDIGRIIKPHGLSGEVVVDLVTNRLERLAVGSVLIVSPDRPAGPSRALPDELEVVAARRHQHRYLVRFRGIVDRNGAEDLRGVVLQSEAVASDGDELFVHELIGALVIDQNGVRHGVVTAVEANPASDILVVDDRSYVPTCFVTAHRDNEIFVEVPDGLFE